MTAVYWIFFVKVRTRYHGYKDHQELPELGLTLKSVTVGNKEELRVRKREERTDIRGKTDPG